MSVTYDAGALIAVDRDDPLMFARHRQAVSQGLVPVVPAPVIWQVWRDGSKQAADGVDAVVVLSAQRRGGVVYTSDPNDLGLLTSYLSKSRFVIYRV